MQQLGNQLERASLTVREVADLLCVSRTAVENRQTKDLPQTPHTSPSAIALDVAVNAFDAALGVAQGRVDDLLAAHRALFPGVDSPLNPSSVGAHPDPTDREVANRLRDELERLRGELTNERTGRAVAEARIDELKSHLRRANAAMTALQADPDVSADLPPA